METKEITVDGRVLLVREDGRITRQSYSITKSNQYRSYTQTYHDNVLMPSVNSSGYYQITIMSTARKPIKCYVHRLVMIAFHGRIPIDYEVDHIDSDKSNNNLSNLQFLTRKENMKKYFDEKNAADKHKTKKVTKTKFCNYCGEVVNNKRSIYCSVNCNRKHTRRFNPTKKELELLVWLKPTSQVAKDFGVSDSAVSKRCKLLNINKPPRGYWAKKKAGKI